MNANDELRAMLDERGANWDYGITGAATTKFSANGVDLTFMPMRDGLICTTILTPAQAIAATLGESMTDTEREALCARIDELCQENERLRKAKDTMRGDAFEIGAMLTKARDENVKLRELSSIMLKCIMANERKALICWECPAHRQFDELRWFCCIKHDAAELGIGVEE